MNKHSRGAARVLAVVLIASLASGCVSDRSRGGTVVISAAGDPDILFPPVARQSAAREVMGLVFDKLADIGADQNTIGDAGWTPRLARAWQWGPDSMSVTFALDPRARWHDSVPVTAADVAFAFSVYTDPVVASSDGALLATLIDSLSVADSLTFTVWFREARPERFYSLVYTLVPLPEHLLGGVARDSLRTSRYGRSPVGNGPFRFVRWDQGQRVEIVASDDYAGGRPNLDRVIWSIVPQGETALQRVLAGEADFIGAPLNPADIAELENHPEVGAVRIGNSQLYYLAFNMRTPGTTRPHTLFADRELRRALTLALDRDAMARNVFDSLAHVPLGPFARTQWSADSSLRQIPFDRAAAARLLDSLGWVPGPDGIRARNGRPLAFPMLVSESSPVRQQLAILMQSQWRSVGVRVDLIQLQGGAVGARAMSGDFDAVLMNIGAGPSPSGVRQAWSTAAFTMSDGLNIGRYSNPDVDAQIDSAVNARSREVARAKYRAAYQLLLDDAAGIWLLEPIVVGAANRRVVMPPLRRDAWWASIPEWRVSGERATATGDTAARMP